MGGIRSALTGRPGAANAGFTLAELLVASFVFLIVSAAFTAALLTALRTHLMAADYYRAICIARNRVQRARTLDFDSIPLMAEVDFPVDKYGDSDPSGGFQRTTMVSNTTVDRVAIGVSVRFPVNGGGLNEVPIEVSTMITRGM